MQARQDFIEAEKDRRAALTSPELPLTELELSKRAVQALAKAKITIVGQVLESLETGDAGLLKVDGFGRKSLADLKRSLKRRGYKLTEAGAEPEES
ncbi:MAG: DNA-directed RNA polymerase subunit alpha C-terminal domain-containing protein [Anaerolineales bacterium]